MPSIKRDNHLLLTEAVIKINCQNTLTEAATIKPTTSVNTPIFRGGRVTKKTLS